MPLQAQWFREWFNSPYYHKLYAHRNDREAAAFIGHLLQFLQPPAGARMVDVACGRGRHARILAAKGFDVTGIDLSPDSIAVARRWESENLHFYEHDMRHLFRINYFDYAFNFFTSFGYFKTDREHYNTIRSMAGSLKPQGILVLDYLNVQYAETHLVPQEKKILHGVTYYITRWFDETHFYKKIIIEDEQQPEPLEYTEQVAKFTIGHFTEMFAFHHLQIQDIFGDYNLCSYDAQQSPRMILVAKKSG